MLTTIVSYNHTLFKKKKIVVCEGMAYRRTSTMDDRETRMNEIQTVSFLSFILTGHCLLVLGASEIITFKMLVSFFLTLTCLTCGQCRKHQHSRSVS